MKSSVTNGKVPLIAIVDDKEYVREALTSLLRSVGYQTADFESAEAFLAAATRSLANCLIVDFHLPGMNGLELQNRLVETRLGCAIILISADLTTDRKERALQAGAVAVLKKPFDDEVLLAAVRSAIAAASSSPKDRQM